MPTGQDGDPEGTHVRTVGCWRTYNSEKWLGYSILSALPFVDEVLVVDGDFDGRPSADRTIEIAGAFSGEIRVHLCQNGSCVGWAGKNEICLALAAAVPNATHLFLVDHDEIVNFPESYSVRSAMASDGLAVGLRRREFVGRLDRLTVQPVSHKMSVMRLGSVIRCETRDGRGYDEYWTTEEGESVLDTGTTFVSDPHVWLDHLRNVEGPGRMYRDLWYRFTHFEEPHWSAADTDNKAAQRLRAHILAHDFFTGGLELTAGHIAPRVFRCKTRRPWQRRILDVCSGAVEHPRPEMVAMDILPYKGVDVVHDATQAPWPFSDGEFDCVTIHHGLEHVHWDYVPRVLREALRVLRHNGSVHIVGPDPTISVERAKSGELDPVESMKQVLGPADNEHNRHHSLLFREWIIDRLTDAGFAHASCLQPPANWEIEFVAFKSSDVPIPPEDAPRP